VKFRAVLVVAALAIALIPLDPVKVERWYSTAFYLRVQGLITPVTNRVPFALLDIAVALCLIGLAFLLARRLKTLGVRRALLRTVLSLVSSAAVLYLLFLALWGLNYRRLPLERKLDWERTRVTQRAAVDLANMAAASVNERFDSAHASRWDATSLERSFGEVQQMLGASRGAAPGTPKRSLLSFYFRWAAIDGMTDPFFLEIIVNSDLLEIERPFVIAHEWAHLAGYADESEANFVAWLTCLRGDALAQYSGWLAAYEHAVRALPSDIRRGLTPLGPGPRSDFQAMAARYAQSSPAVREAAHDVYDSYLKANRVQEGIASYDAVVRLMLGTRFGPAWTPVVR
jgi:hypothetical protein